MFNVWRRSWWFCLSIRTLHNRPVRYKLFSMAFAIGFQFSVVHTFRFRRVDVAFSTVDSLKMTSVFRWPWKTHDTINIRCAFHTMYNTRGIRRVLSGFFLFSESGNTRYLTWVTSSYLNCLLAISAVFHYGPKAFECATCTCAIRCI